MSEKNFIDQIRIFCKSGNGGAGSVHFMRTKFNAFAGPDGGNGGRGGHIILKGNQNLWTLLHLRYKKNILADNGGKGSKNNSSGKNGDDIIIEVPIGTIAKNEETNTIEAEILHHGQEVIWLKGGRGGMGNSFFKTATKQTPDFAQPGENGIEGWRVLELKILADVGMVGFPNAGKSTLLSVLSAAKPKIADYPFTTLVPNLGIVSYKNNLSFCLADIPGIIEGASEGKGLGLQFLRHIERNSVLLFVISAETPDIVEQYNILKNELQTYNETLLHKKNVLVITKLDIADEKFSLKKIAKKLPDLQIVTVSAAQQKGLEELKNILWNTLQQA